MSNCRTSPGMSENAWSDRSETKSRYQGNCIQNGTDSFFLLSRILVRMTLIKYIFQFIMLNLVIYTLKLITSIQKVYVCS